MEFKKVYKALLEKMMSEGECRAIKKQAKQKELETEALSHPMIQKAIEVFDVTNVEIQRERKKRSHRASHSGGRVHHLPSD